MTENKSKFTYVMDPFCGWCYGNSQNIVELVNTFQSDFDFEIYSGGMWSHTQAQTGGPGLSQFLQQHSPRLIEMTGVHIDDAFFKAAANPNSTFDSFPPSAAIVWMKKNNPERVFEFSSKIQSKLFQEGANLNEAKVYIEILDAMGISFDQFSKEWMQEENQRETKDEMYYSRSLANGYPTLLLTHNGQTSVVTSGYFDLEQMTNAIRDFQKKITA